MKRFLIFCCLFIFFTNYIFAQNSTIFLENYYKNEFLRFSKNACPSSFYPSNEGVFKLSDSIKDKRVFYYDLPVWFFQKHWIQVEKEQFSIHISPLIHFAYGKSTDTVDIKPLFRNSRGIYLDGQLGSKFSFQFVISENQSSFCDYEAQYFKDRGELYVTPNGYTKVNAVIPSASRTKYFKDTIYPNAFDYAFSVGAVAYQINNKSRVEFGNTQQFIGNGYRSLFLSDNSTHAPFFRFQRSFCKRWCYNFLSKKTLNLIRKPFSNGIEKSYENKWFLAHYLTFQVKENLNISFFTGGIHLRADSIQKHSINPLFILPTFNTDLWNHSSIVNGINGLNIDYFLSGIKCYAQIVMDQVNKKTLFASQLGIHYFNVLKIKRLDFQIEWNQIPEDFYSNSNFKLAYSHSNLSITHPKGNNFSELYFRLSFMYKRFQFLCSFSNYFTRGGDIYSQIIQNNLFLTSDKKKMLFSQNGQTQIYIGEIIYRWNNRYNAQLYFQFRSRISNFGIFHQQNNSYLAGVRMSLFNQYLDF
ncbi:MAG: hypothetical protein HYU67_01175 [Flavobacteriia bacterium]|nr:hypothetical protein [Flavobacteriia bacterium]